MVGNIGPMPHEAVANAITPFIGQPISRKLISDVQATIARVYREAGYPFVSVTLPPHNASRGFLQVRVVEFRAGKLSIDGAASAQEADHLTAQVRSVPGDRIQAARLEEDLDWINRNPYRTVQGVFAPGDVVGASDFTLKVTDSKPWQVFAGYSNTGQQSTGYDRYYVGAGAVIAPLNDTVVSYQLTGSSDFWSNNGFDDGLNAARYQSQSARITIPTWSRQALEIAPNFVETLQAQDSFITFNNKIFELPVIYRSAISNILPGVYLGDVYGGGRVQASRSHHLFCRQQYRRGQRRPVPTGVRLVGSLERRLGPQCLRHPGSRPIPATCSAATPARPGTCSRPAGSPASTTPTA